MPSANIAPRSSPGTSSPAVGFVKAIATPSHLLQKNKKTMPLGPRSLLGPVSTVSTLNLQLGEYRKGGRRSPAQPLEQAQAEQFITTPSSPSPQHREVGGPEGESTVVSPPLGHAATPADGEVIFKVDQPEMVDANAVSS